MKPVFQSQGRGEVESFEHRGLLVDRSDLGGHK